MMSASMHQTAVQAQGFTVLFEPESPKIDIVFIHGFNGDAKETWTARDQTSAAGGLPPNDRRGPTLIQWFRKMKARARGSNPSFSPSTKSTTWSRRASFVSRTAAGGDGQLPDIDINSPQLAGPVETVPEDGAFWPQDLVPQTIPHARVLTYGYDTKIRHVLQGRVSQNTVYDHAWNFLCLLEQTRRSEAEASRPLLFVAHSLGGIVLKEALRRSRSYEGIRPGLFRIVLATQGVIFFGTPHRGADPRSTLHLIITWSAEAFGVGVNQDIVDSLMPNDSRVLALGSEFVLMAKRYDWRIHSFQEEYGVRRLRDKKVVEDESSCVGDPTIETRQHILANHMNMCRFHSGILDPEYGKVAAALHRLATRISEPVAGPGSLSPSSPAPPPAVYPVQPLPGAAEPLPSVGTLLGGAARLVSERRLVDLLTIDRIDDRLTNIQSPEAKTRRWFLEKREYVRWMQADEIDEHRGFLWIKGKPGSGKSVLMKYLYSDASASAKDQPDTVVLPFFFNARSNDEPEKSTMGLYRSVLSTLFGRLPAIRTEVLGEIDESTADAIQHNGWNAPTLKESLRRAVEKLGHRTLILFVDALDECDVVEVADMVSFFEELGDCASDAGSKLRICLSSRHYPSVVAEHGYEIVLEAERDQAADLERYIDSKLRLKNYNHTNNLKAELLRKSSGIFLWAVLVIRLLNKEFSAGRVFDLRKTLDEIPPGLDKLFELIITRDNENLEDLKHCLLIVNSARTPLPPTELYLALRLLQNPALESPASLPRRILLGTLDTGYAALGSMASREDTERFVQSCSKGMAEVSVLNTVQFIHESVRDFIKDRQKVLDFGGDFLGKSHDQLKECCLRQMRVLQHHIAKAYSNEEKVDLKSYPFLRYAATNVLHHANLAQAHGVDQREFIDQFSHRLQRKFLERDLIEVASLDFDVLEPAPDPVEFHLLYTLARQNLSELIRVHPDLKRNLNLAFDSENFVSLPLLEAISAKNGAAFAELVQPWSETKLDYGDASKSLERQWPGRAKDAFEWAVKRGLSGRQTLIHTLSPISYEPAVYAFIQTRAEPDELCVTDEEAYRMITETNSKEVVKMLLQAGVDPNGRDGNGSTALFSPRTDGIAEVLLDHGADVLAQNHIGLTPLHQAAMKGRTALAGILMRAGTDPKAEASSGNCSILKAKDSHVATTRVAHDADPRKTHATEAGLARNVAPLIGKEMVEIDASDAKGRTPLSYAAQAGHLGIVRLLAGKRTVEIDSKDGMGRTPFSHAAEAGCHDAARLLKERYGAQVDWRDSKGRTPLSYAAGSRDVLMAEFLLGTGQVEADSVDREGKSVLRHALEGHPSGSNLLSPLKSVVDILLTTRRVNVLAPAADGRSPLDFARQQVVRPCLTDEDYLTREVYQCLVDGMEDYCRTIGAHGKGGENPAEDDAPESTMPPP